MIVSRAFAGKRYAVLGLARSGLASVESLLAGGADVTVWDNREEPRSAFEGSCTIADPLSIDLTGFAGVVVSPGVPLNRHPIADHARAAGVPVIGDIELFAQARADLPPHRVVGITGTNGKSTTTMLVHHICAAAGLPARLGGNIGLPILGQEPLPEGGVYVLELSSYQIDLTQSLACDVAALINLSPDHLDRYDGFAGYAASKARLFAMQRADQHAVFGCGDEHTLEIAREASATHDTGFVHVVQPSALHGQLEWPSLQGPHNLQNAAIAVEIARQLGIAEDIWRSALASFVGLPHRMERVAEANGVLFVNDSKATNPASTAPALGAYPRIHWILGGLPKSDNLDECAPYFDHVVAAYTIGEAGPRFAEILEPVMPVTRSEMLCDAVRQAMEAAQPGDVVMLSPACASFDQFRDFEARGDSFRQIVEALIEDREAPCPDGTPT
ncbi:UDP-N-acetylmuramoylalanine--D-glutamate ligase [Novosphingobium aromaticivorans DSM 12444]|uniref:UDP-N-acetylmuramoylalanine--D-glutamate ligase n=1 Tax=Novosphingobium aromaticivorans (strain ATCC 700278 / DSM 12444 / CCUG 56034 / CIP 105152 / NBRC 16084 / F199) TaxID=279238 RepID=MURD_NOVAD|nr:UDP-N-acetylmuramoyl-L-alanine--D-glutamate ligase [Novosphingobium aromaticivorans]Q2G997.1 RecName: Full=UDP-N-acetylmuramoylalanine--D-glutamate ligase; AltName: Full=D-glutamic acid-adding enzyme; AltName: Full=UDP-N-acetylmuramoyl-L-alanyl-D-glutamate synthetase [Novosphingobium aromaticivorans DSM 12444]ABD25576.1 UDP-N-acetylmuramoylalanine--D-glutamate ligase [Novosphingobium aromaticivorans DSM 12444]SCX97618.1 UDP-N-acetylmuramoylalanine--D-glutamate ligase [Novosphingobium aromatic